MEAEENKISYLITGIDDEGNLVLEHPLTPHEVIAILAKKAGSTLVESNPQVETARPIDIVGRPIKSLQEKRAKLKEVFDGVKRRGRTTDPVVIAQAQELRAGGMSLREIGAQLGMGMSTVHKMLADAGGVKKK